MARLFVAVWPTADVVAVLEALPRPEVAGVRWAPPESWAVKLRPLGYVSADLVGPLSDALAVGLDGAPAARCELGPATERLAGQWLGAPVSGLDDLAAAVFEATEPLVPVTHPQPYAGTLVLARGQVPRELAGAPVAAAWTAREVTLVVDRSSPRAARYDRLTTIPLGH